LPRPNFVIATQNPIDQQGTYTLPEAQLDRFMMLLRIGYPGAEQEMRIVADAIARRLPEQLHAVMTVEELLRMADITRAVYMAPALQSFIVTITGATRTVAQLRLGASPRASNSLAIASQACAAFEGRPFVTADDVKAMAPSVLRHRMLLRPEIELQGRTADDLLQTILTSVPVPQQRVGV
jgi:MoxR-like ATPase